MTGAEYQTQFDTLVGRGYRLVFVDGYTVSGQPQYAAIWEQSSGPEWVARHGLTSQQYQQAFDTYTSQGYRLKHVSGYAQGNTALYAAIWEKSGTNVEWVAHHGMTSAGYQNEFNSWVGNGYTLKVVSGYTLYSNEDRYAALWFKE